MGSCSIANLPTTWFEAAGSASVRVEVRYGSLVVADGSAAAELTLHAKPSWFEQREEVLSSAGAFAALPVSPVFAAEEFGVEVYAHSGGYQLETWWVELLIDTSLLEYVTFAQSDLFNGVTYSPGGVDSSILRFQAVGTRSSTRAAQVPAAAPVAAPAARCAPPFPSSPRKPRETQADGDALPEQVTGTAIFLLRATLRFKPGVAAATYEHGLLRVVAQQQLARGVRRQLRPVEHLELPKEHRGCRRRTAQGEPARGAEDELAPVQRRGRAR